MTNNSISFVSLSLDNGSGMTRKWFDHGSTIPRKLFSLLFVLFFCIGQMWADKLEITYNGTTTGWTITDCGWGSSYWGLRQTTTYCITSPTISDLSTITSIEVYARTYGTTSGNSNKIGVYSGNTQIGSNQTATSSFSTYTFTPSNLSGSGTIRVQSQGTASSAGLRVSRVTINYTPSAASHTLSSAINPANSGTVSLSATSVAEGSTATATATPAAHYTFTSWSISGTGASLSSTTTNPTTVTMGTANATVTATFTAVPKASITLYEAGTPTTDETTYYVGEEYTLPSTTDATCNGKVLVGWSTVTVAETNTKPTLNYYEKGAKVTLAATQTFYAVFATASTGAAPTAYTAGDEGTFVLAANVSGTWYALPANPTVSSGKIAGEEITVSTSATSVNYVTSTNASGYEWTIADATNGQTISDGTSYIYHSNGGASGTNLTYGNGTTYTWNIASETGGLTFQAMNGSTTNSRGMLVSGTQFGGYALSNEGGSGYSRIQVLPISDGTTYTAYSTDCCQPLASINGSFFRCHFLGRNLEFSSYHYVKGRFAHF